MLPAYLNIRDVDRRVRELIVRMNRLPYAVSISSCEGHVKPADSSAEGFLIMGID